VSPSALCSAPRGRPPARGAQIYPWPAQLLRRSVPELSGIFLKSGFVSLDGAACWSKSRKVNLVKKPLHAVLRLAGPKFTTGPRGDEAAVFFFFFFFPEWMMHSIAHVNAGPETKDFRQRAHATQAPIGPRTHQGLLAGRTALDGPSAKFGRRNLLFCLPSAGRERRR